MTVEGGGPPEAERAADDRFGRAEALPVAIDAPETLGYRIKCRLLGPPLTNVELKGERLSKKTALGVLSSDCISSSVESSSIAASPAYRAELCDESGGVTLLFYGRRKIEGLDPGALVRVEGRVGERHGYLAMANPSYEILPSP